jgi:hypothetical protein
VLEILRHLFPRKQNLTISCPRIYCKTQEENLLCSLTDGTFSSPPFQPPPARSRNAPCS